MKNTKERINIKNNLFTSLVLLFVSLGVNSQVEKTKQLPSIAIGMGVLSFDGDIGNGIGVSSLSKVKLGYHLAVEQRIGSFLGVSIRGLYGKLADNENTSTRNLNFQSQIIQGDLNVVFHFDNGFIMKKDIEFAPYVSVGIGYLKFDPYGDLKDKSGTPYVYWNDGTIHNLPQNDPNVGNAITLHRDYTYETQLKDSMNKYTRGTLSIPVGVGFKFNLTRHLDFNLGGTYYITMTDWIDNYKKGGNDKYLYVNASLQYTFKPRLEEKKIDYKSVDFASMEKEDTDGDGVKDMDDLCTGTPKGIKIDSHGCPLDTDGDGVPDYKDKEPKSIKGAIVDDNGVGVSDSQLAQKQSKYDSLAAERSKVVYDYPSLSYLKQVAPEKKKKNPEGLFTIPYALRSADKNGDDYISPEEILETVDSFLEGDSEFTVEKLNDLIDFFFEQ